MKPKKEVENIFIKFNSKTEEVSIIEYKTEKSQYLKETKEVELEVNDKFDKQVDSYIDDYSKYMSTCDDEETYKSILKSLYYSAYYSGVVYSKLSMGQEIINQANDIVKELYGNE